MGCLAIWRLKEKYTQYDLYSRTCVDVSSMIEGIDLKFSCAPVEGIKYLRNIIKIESSEGVIIFILDIFNAFQNSILTELKERFNPSLPHIYL